MKADTPFFRAALSVAAIWMAFWAYATYASYRLEYRDPYGLDFAADPPAADDCYSQKLDWEGSDSVWRDPTEQEKADCVALSFRTHRQLVEDGNNSLLRRSWVKFLEIGALPACALLFLVAFWPGLTAASIGIIRRYAAWLHYGAAGPDGHDS